MTHKPLQPKLTTHQESVEPAPIIMELTTATPRPASSPVHQHRPSSAFKAWSRSVQIIPCSSSPSPSPSTSATPASTSMSSKVAPRGVVAGTHIPAGASCEFDLSTLSFSFEGSSKRQQQPPIQISCNAEGELEQSSNESKQPWTKDLVLAKDCHSRNFIISISSSEEGIRCDHEVKGSGRVCNELQPGTPIFGWFSEELCSAMGMPFLGLNHIKGRGSYSCDRCEAIFKDPNPLKIHLLLNCGQTSPKKFWSRLLQPSTPSPSNGNGSPRQSSPPESHQSIDLSSRKPNVFKENIPRSSGPASSGVKNGQGAPKTMTEYFHPVKTASVARYSPPMSSSSILADALARGAMSSSAQKMHTTMANAHSITAAAAASLAAQLTSSGFGPFVTPSQAAEAGSSQLLNRMGPSGVPAMGDIGGQFSGFPGLFPGLPFAQTALLGLRFPGIYAHQAMFHQQQQQQALNLQMGSQVLPPCGPPQVAPSTSSPTNSVTPPASAAVPMTNAELEAMVSNIGKSKGGHLCIYCGKVYSRKYGLKIHIRTHTGYKPLRCKVCLRPFGDPSNLNKHIRLHAQGDTPYRCDLCGKILVRRRDLERHILSRHPEHQATLSAPAAASPDHPNNGSSPHAEPDTSCASTSHQASADDSNDSPRGSDSERESLQQGAPERKKRRISDPAANMSPSSTDDFAPTSSTMAAAGLNKS